MNCKALLAYYIDDCYGSANIAALENIKDIQVSRRTSKFQGNEYYRYVFRIALGILPIDSINERLMTNGLLEGKIAEMEELLGDEEISRYLVLHVNTTDFLDIMISPEMMGLLKNNNIELDLKIHDKRRF